jgi:hypothetical protein
MARREREPLEMVEFARRAIKAAGRHVGNADEFELAELVSLREDLETVIATAVHQQRAWGRSWAYIGNALGLTRQAAQQRYGDRVSA